ncbi:MAG TPA: DUF692 domain-containing protein [Caulobacteraceae bacterium]|nr:DUF692 domain-containing protein [Caulobacteraceae bacterium]
MTMAPIAPQAAHAASAQPIPARAGIGLRLPHHRALREDQPDTAWFEVHPENYIAPALADELAAFAERYPISLHAVGLSLGSACGLDIEHLDRLASLERRIQPGLMSDHLSWSVARVGDSPLCLPDLLPLPYTEEALAIVRANVEQAQARLGRQLLIENPSTYLRFAQSALSEAEFLGELACATGCGVLLDINNVYVSARNHGEEPAEVLDGYLDAIPAAAVGEIHLAGHAVRALEDGAELRIDDHGSRVCADVWVLCEQALAKLGPRPVLIEWDTAIPPFAVLQEEAALAERLLESVGSRQACHV